MIVKDDNGKFEICDNKKGSLLRELIEENDE